MAAVIPRQRNQSGEWPVEVGDRRNGGHLGAALGTTVRGERVLVNATELTGITVDVSVEDARRFAHGLLDLLSDGDTI